MKNEKVIWFEKEKCTQCHGCELACRSWRGLPQQVFFRKVINVWEGNFPAVRSHSVSLSCVHCVEPACVEACPEGALSKREADGVVLVDESLCTGCGSCFDACPYQVPRFGADGVMQKCDLCEGQNTNPETPPCVETCPGNALSVRVLEKAEKSKYQSQLADLLGRH